MKTFSRGKETRAASFSTSGRLVSGPTEHLLHWFGTHFLLKDLVVWFDDVLLINFLNLNDSFLHCNYQVLNETALEKASSNAQRNKVVAFTTVPDKFLTSVTSFGICFSLQVKYFQIISKSLFKHVFSGFQLNHSAVFLNQDFRLCLYLSENCKQKFRGGET